MTLVHQLMTSPVATCHVDATLESAARLMWEQDCGVVPVVDDFGRLVGIVTDRDACMAAYTQGIPLREIPVAAAMCSNVNACHPDDSVALATQRMQEHQLRRLPVVDEEHCPVGILSMNDLVRNAVRPSAGQRDAAVEVIRALAAIGRHRHEHTGRNGTHKHTTSELLAVNQPREAGSM